MTSEEFKYLIAAKFAGVWFIGMQERKNGPAIPLFTDPLTKGTFTLENGESVRDALKRKRKQWGLES